MSRARIKKYETVFKNHFDYENTKKHNKFVLHSEEDAKLPI